jgi:Mce-associated membrane protein
MSRSGTEEDVRVVVKGDVADSVEANAADQEAADDSRVAVTQRKSDTAGPDASDREAAEDPELDEMQQKPTEGAIRRLRVSISIRTLVGAMVIVAVLASAGVPTWLYLGAKAKLDDQARQAANSSHAERIALDYAVGAAKIDAKDLEAWKKNLVKGTTPELKEKLSSAGTSMEQILVPLQWNSTATPLVAKVRSNANGIYVVDTFVGVETKTMQAPDGLQSTATYSITINSNNDWQISDVGGIGTVAGQK